MSCVLCLLHFLVSRVFMPSLPLACCVSCFVLHIMFMPCVASLVSRFPVSCGRVSCLCFSCLAACPSCFVSHRISCFTVSHGVWQVGDRGAQALASALPTLKLETLDLGFNNVATAGVAALMQVCFRRADVLRCHVYTVTYCY